MISESPPDEARSLGVMTSPLHGFKLENYKYSKNEESSGLFIQGHMRDDLSLWDTALLRRAKEICDRIIISYQPLLNRIEGIAVA